MAKRVKKKQSVDCVTFLGWQEGYGSTSPFPLFNVNIGNGRITTLSAESVKDLGHKVPEYPSFGLWKKSQGRDY